MKRTNKTVGNDGAGPRQLYRETPEAHRERYREELETALNNRQRYYISASAPNTDMPLLFVGPATREQLDEAIDWCLIGGGYVTVEHYVPVCAADDPELVRYSRPVDAVAAFYRGRDRYNTLPLRTQRLRTALPRKASALRRQFEKHQKEITDDTL